jgi:hypothetical protein
VIAQAECGQRQALAAVKRYQLREPEPVVFEIALLPLNLKLDGAGFLSGNTKEDRRRLLPDDDGGGERTRLRKLAGKRPENGVHDIVRGLMSVSPDVGIGGLDTVSGGGAGPEFSRWIQPLIMREEAN